MAHWLLRICFLLALAFCITAGGRPVKRPERLGKVQFTLPPCNKTADPNCMPVVESTSGIVATVSVNATPDEPLYTFTVTAGVGDYLTLLVFPNTGFYSTPTYWPYGFFSCGSYSYFDAPAIKSETNDTFIQIPQQFANGWRNISSVPGYVSMQFSATKAQLAQCVRLYNNGTSTGELAFINTTSDIDLIWDIEVAMDYFEQYTSDESLFSWYSTSKMWYITLQETLSGTSSISFNGMQSFDIRGILSESYCNGGPSFFNHYFTLTTFSYPLADGRQVTLSSPAIRTISGPITSWYSISTETANFVKDSNMQHTRFSVITFPLSQFTEIVEITWQVALDGISYPPQNVTATLTINVIGDCQITQSNTTAVTCAVDLTLYTDSDRTLSTLYNFAAENQWLYGTATLMDCDADRDLRFREMRVCVGNSSAGALVPFDPNNMATTGCRSTGRTVIKNIIFSEAGVNDTLFQYTDQMVIASGVLFAFKAHMASFYSNYYVVELDWYTKGRQLLAGSHGTIGANGPFTGQDGSQYAIVCPVGSYWNWKRRCCLPDDHHHDDHHDDDYDDDDDDDADYRHHDRNGAGWKLAVGVLATLVIVLAIILIVRCCNKHKHRVAPAVYAGQPPMSQFELRPLQYSPTRYV